MTITMISTTLNKKTGTNMITKIIIMIPSQASKRILTLISITLSKISRSHHRKIVSCHISTIQSRASRASKPTKLTTLRGTIARLFRIIGLQRTIFLIRVILATTMWRAQLPKARRNLRSLRSIVRTSRQTTAT